MQSIDGQDVNMLQYFKDNNIPHTYQCSKCGVWMGDHTKPECTHNWIIRDLRPFQNGASDAISNRDNSVPGTETDS